MEGDAAAAVRTRTLDVYGLRIALGGDWPEVVDQVFRDFAWFGVPEETARVRAPQPHVTIRIRQRAPAYDLFGELPAAFVTPRNTVYQRDARTVVDYFGRALSVLDRDTDTLVVDGEDEQLVREAAYQFMLSRIGEHLDGRRLPRLHALAVAGPGGAAAILLPSGGGKSTLALRALRDPSVTLLSEDSPLIDRRGWLHPFPLRIGVNPNEADDLPTEHVRRVERMEFHPKLLLNVEAFADRIEAHPLPLRHLVIGRRSLGTEASLERLPRGRAVGPLLREAVVGVGLYQGMEFVLQRGLRDVAQNVGVFLTRSACCAAGLARASVWQLTLGRDHERNWAVVRELLG
jgi:hypothetical protein